MAFQTIDDLVRENRRMIQDKGTDRAYIEAVRRWSREVGMPDTPLIDATKPIERKSKFVEGLETTAKVVGGGLAKGTVRIARQLGNQMERGITAPMTNPELTVRQNIINFADRLYERSADAARTADAGEATRVGAITKATVNTLKDLASQFIYEDNPLLSASMGVPSLVAANPIVQFTKGMMSTGETESDRLIKPIEEKIAKWADVSDKNFMIKVLASSFESLPQTLLTRGGVAGIPIMLTSAYQSNMEALVAEGHNPADKMTIINALASAGVEVATEYMFGAFKGVATGVKTGAKVAGSGAKTAILTGTKGFMDEILGRVAKQAVKPTVWNITKEIILSGAEEGIEEVISAIGSMFIAKVTTDQERQMFSFDKNSAAILTFEELAQAGLSGAIMGSTLASIQMGVNRKKFTNTRLAAEEFYQKDFKDITQQDYQKFIDAISKDMNDPKNVKDVLNDLRNAQKAAQANAGEEAAPKTTTTGDQTDTVETPVEVTPDTTKTVVSETPADYSDATKFITVEGNPIQQANIVEVNKRLHDFYVQRESAVKTNNQPMIKGIDMSIQQLRNIAKKTVDTPDYNHFKLKESDAPQATATTPQTTAAATATTAAPAAPAAPAAATTATAQAAPTATATTTATAAQPVQQAPKGAVKTTTGTQKVVKKTRADYPTYYEWLLHQLDALKGRADKTQSPNEKRKLLGTRIPEMLAMIKAEEAAVAAGTTTEVTDVPKTTKGKGKVKSTAQQAPEPVQPAPVQQQTPAPAEPIQETKPVAKGKAKAQPKQEAKAQKKTPTSWADLGGNPNVEQGLEYEEYQKIIDDYEDELIKKYGLSAVLGAPVFYRKIDSLDENLLYSDSSDGYKYKKTPLTYEELAKLEALYNARNAIETEEMKQEIDKIMSAINPVKRSSQTPWVIKASDIRSFLEESQRSSTNLFKMFGKTVERSTEELAKHVYHRLIQSTPFPWDMFNYEDAVLALNSQQTGRGMSVVSANMSPIFDAINQVLRATGVTTTDFFKTDYTEERKTKEAITGVPALPAGEAKPVAKGKTKSAPKTEAKPEPMPAESDLFKITFRDRSRFAKLANQAKGMIEYNIIENKSEVPQALLDMADVYETQFGVRTVFFEGKFVGKTGASYTNGFTPFNDNEVVFINVNRAFKLSKPAITFGHEFSHLIEVGDYFDEVFQAVADIYGITNSDDLEQLASAIDKVTGNKGLGISYIADYMGIENVVHHLKGEIVAFHAAKYFTDEAFLKRLDSHLGIKSDGFFSKIYKWFKGIVSGTNDYETKSFFDAYLKNLDSFLQKERPDIYRKITERRASLKGKVKNTDQTATPAETATTADKKRTAAEAMTQKREELADEFLAEPKRIDPQTINGFDKQQASAAVVRNINDIQTHVAAHGNRLIANLGFNMTKDRVTFDEDFFGTADNKTRTNMSLMNFNTLMSFYKDIGLERFATKMLVMKKMMGELNEYSPEEITAKHGATYGRIFAELYNKADGEILNNMYISFNEKIDKKSLVTYPMSSPANNIPFFNVVFSSKAATTADTANYGLIPMYVTSPVKKAKTTKTTETKPSKKKPKTAGAFETARYDTAKISVVADSDNKKYVVSFSTYVDEERTVLLKRLGYKLNTVDKTWSHPMIDGSTIETALAKLVEGLEKIERLSSIVVQAPAKIETEDDGVVIKEISYEQREVEPNVDGGNSDAINNIDGAMKFHNKTEKGNPLQAIKDFFVETFGRGELPNLPRWQYGNLRALLLQNLRASNIAASMAENYITIYNRLNPEQYKKAMRVIVLRDIVDDAVNLRLDIETNKTWGFNNLNEVAAELYKAEQSMYADPIVETVVNDRNEILETIRELYIENAKIAGYDANVLFTHSDYFHHSVQDIEEAIKSVKSGRNALMDSWIYEQRHNANKPYLTDPALADYMTMHQMFRDIKKMELLGELKRLDRSKEFPPGKKLPEGYVQETVSVIGYVFPEDAIADSLEKIAIDMADVMGLTGADKEAYIKEMRKQMPAKRLVIPTEVAKTCRALLTQKDKSKLDKATKQAVKAWKYIMIKAPHRIVNYNVRNFVGDLDAMLAAYPGAVKYIAQSYGDLRDFFKDIPMTPEQIQKRQDEIASGKRKDNLITDYIWSGGMTTGLSDVEFQNFQRYGRFDFYGGEFQSEDPSKIVSAIKGALGKKGGIETFTQFREQLLRYATFLYLMNEGMDKNNIPVQGKAGKVVNFGASYVPEILSLRSRVGRAAKLANDALGAYDDVSMFAAKLSDSAIPFFRFKWINATRYFNLFRNAFMSDQKALAKAGLNVAKRYGALGRVSASAALRLGRLVAMGSIVTLTQVLANTVWNLVDEDEPEKDLPDYVRDSIHLYLGAIGGRSHYYTGLGSIGDLADFLGIYTAISDFKEVVEKRMTVGDYVKQQALAPVRSVTDQMFPLLRLLTEPLTGVKSFPETANIRSIPEHIFGAFGFKDVYRRISSLPDKPINIFNSIVGIFGNSAETEYAVYWQARELVDKYKADNGQAISDPTPNISTKGNAIYYFKEAVRLGDKKSAIKQLAKYIAEGGTRESYDASLATLHPLGNIAKSQRDEFYQGLSDSEKRTVDRAIALYERIILEGEEVASSQLEGTTGNRPAQSAISPELQREIDAMIEEVKRINGD